MKLLLAMNLPYFHTQGGANRANRLLLEELVRCGHEVRAVVPALGVPAALTLADWLDRVRAVAPDARVVSGVCTFSMSGVAVRATTDPATLLATLKREIVEFAPDRILVSSEDASHRILAACLDAEAAPVVLLAHSLAFLPFGPESFFPSPARTKLFERAAALLCCSRFVAEYVTRWAGLPARYVPLNLFGSGPFPRLGRHDDGFVMMINPCAVKGVSIFAALADALPQYSFAAVASWGTTSEDRALLLERNNMTVLESFQDIDAMYGCARLLVVPSLWVESFGRVVVEAMQRGIPVIASDVGGLREATLGEGILVPVRPIKGYGADLDAHMIPRARVPEQDVEPWVVAVRSVLASRESYERMSSAVRAAATSDAVTRTIEPLERAIIEVTKLPPRAPKAAASVAPDLPSSALATRLAQLSPAQRALVLQRLGKGASLARVEDPPRHEQRSSGAVAPVPRDAPLPLSYGQEGLLFLERLDPGTSRWNIPLARRFRGPLDVPALERALVEVTSRHESFRTTLSAQTQTVAPPTTWKLAIVDLGARADVSAALTVHIKSEMGLHFDLANGPVFRAKLFRLAPNEHVLLLVAHHAVSDGLSFLIVERELLQVYESLRRGLPSPLAPPAIQYADYAFWQRQWASGAQAKSQLAFWKRHLEGAETLELPTDRPRPPTLTFTGAVHRFLVSAELARAVAELSRAERASPFMMLQAAFAALVSRYSGQSDISMSTPVTSRSLLELESVVGFFVNTVVLRSDLSGAPTTRELLRRVRSTTLAAYENQEVPFEQVVEAVRPTRDMSRAPLAQVSFVAFVEAAPPSIPGLTVESVDVDALPGEHDLAMIIVDTKGRLEGRVEYSTDLFDASTIARMTEHMLVLLEGMTSCPDVPVAKLPMLTEGERHRLLAEWSTPSRPHAWSDAVLHELVSARTASAPWALAVEDETGALTYGDLEERSSVFGAYLVARGVCRGDVVALLLPRSTEAVVAMLGVMKAGAAYLPMDCDLPDARIRYMVEDSGARVLVATEPESRKGLATIVLSLSEAAGAAHAAVPERAVSPSDLAYVIYTSGSTGSPKGVAIEHRTISAMARELANDRELTGGRRQSQYASLSFDAHVTEIWSALISGASVHVVPEALRRDPAGLVSWLGRERIHWAFMPTPVGEECLRTEWSPNELVGLPLGGDALRGVPNRTYPFVIQNVYGPTECTCHTTTATVRPGDLHPSIGRPIGGVRVYVLDGEQQIVGTGVVGQLYIGGALVGRGYHRRPELTASQFVPDPFSGAPSARMYATGDTARWRGDGQLDLLGRIDHQVKIRGRRIELGEVESRLATCDGVAASVVVAHQYAEGDKRLVAYVVPAAGVTLSGDVLRSALARELSEYMVPTAFVVLEAMPLTKHGKVDRKSLPRLDHAALSAATHVAPEGATETGLASIWSAVLQVERVGATDNFFTLGGHSLLLARVTSRVLQDFNVHLAMRALFKSSTLRAMASVIDELRQTSAPAVRPIVPILREGSLRLSFAQERLLFLTKLEPDSTAYHLPFAKRISGKLNTSALDRALTELLRRHEVLRTGIVDTGGEPAQVVQPPPVTTLVIEEAPKATDADVRRHADDDARAPFDLATSPLRVKLLRIGAEDHLLLLNIHHIACDGWSSSILWRELSELYTAFASGRDSPLAALPIQYVDYAAWQRAQMATESANDDLAYWTSHLADAPTALALPTDRAGGAVQSHRGEQEFVSLSTEVTQALNQFGSAAGASLFMTLLAAFSLVLARHSGQEDVVIGVPVAERSHAELEGLIGLLLKTLPMRMAASGNPSFRSLVARARETSLASYAHQAVPFERIVEELKIARSLSRTPIFQVMLVSTKFGGEATSHLGGLPMTDVGTSVETSKYDLTLYFDDSSGELGLRFVYNADLFDRLRMREMLGQLVEVLRQGVTHPDVGVESLSLVTARARQILPDPRTALESTWQGSVTELFARQAANEPDRLAVADGRDRWTYAELESVSNQLAHRLLAAGVKRGEPVAIVAHRSASLACAVLGVLKSGAVFVMLDPAYPSARLVAILEAAKVRALVRLTDGPMLDRAVEAWFEGSGLRTRIDLPGRGALGALFAGAPATAPDTVTTADDLAYIAFTSGSTGKPKGVLGRHGPLVHFQPWRTSEFGLTAEDRFSMLSGLAHDPLHRDLFTPLLLGASLHVIDPEEMMVPGRLAAWMAAERITVTHLTPAFGQLLTDHARAAPLVDSLRLIFLVGDALTGRDVERLETLAPNAQCVNYYGATETQQALSYYVVPKVTPRDVAFVNRVIPLGRGTPDVQLLVIAGGGDLAGIGELGEITFRTPHLARGYLDDPELTAERFAPHPAGAASGGERRYRTGDLGRYTTGGDVVFAGRADRQVKVRGFRVELGEVEAAIASVPTVAQAVVVARTDEAGERRLVAYVVPRAAEFVDVAEVRVALSATLPDYMLPGVFIALDALPLTPNGKLDRRALPEADFASVEVPYVAPRTPLEQTMAQIWKDVLKIERVGIHDDYFDLGGHSLNAMQMVARLQEQIRVAVPVRALFDSPTLAGLAATVVELLQPAGPSTASVPVAEESPLVPVPRDGVLPLSFTQQRLWFLGELEAGAAELSLSEAVRHSGPLDVAALERAIEALHHRQEILRTRIVVRSGVPSLEIAAPSKYALPIVETKGTSDEIRRLIEADCARPFDLAKSPIRFVLRRVSLEDHILVTSVHHLVCDGWSIELIGRDLATLYEAFAAGQPSPLAPLRLQYVDYAAWQRARAVGPSARTALAYWIERLSGASPVLELPTDRPRTGKYRSESCDLVCSKEVARAVQELGRRAGTSMFMTFLAAFSLVLARHSGQDDVIVGSPVAHRPSSELEEVVGLFLNTIALRISVAANPTFLQLLEQARNTSLDGFAHQDVPFETVVEHINPERTRLYAPVYQVMMNAVSFEKHARALAGVRTEQIDLEGSPSKFDLTLYVREESPDRLQIACAYNAELFDRLRVQEMLAQLTQLLVLGAAQPGAPVKSLSLLTPHAAKRLPDPGAALDEQWHGSVADVFARQAAMDPDRLAVCDSTDRWSYGELDARSNQLAQRLVAAGVQRGDRVAILAHRSASLACAVLGILKAGAAFVMLDPGYPAARLVAILDVARPRAVVRVADATPLDEPIARWCDDADLRARIDLPRKGDLERLFDGHPVEPLRLVITADDLAYVAFTSGSTGKPKGVLGRHGPLSHFQPWRCREFALTREDRFSMLSGLAHDPLHRDLFTPFQLGGSLHVIDADELMTPMRLAAWMKDQRITVAHLTPAFGQLLTSAPEAGTQLESLRRIFLVGDALSRDLVADLEAIAPNARCVNYYGATETQQALSYYVIPRPGAGETVAGPANIPLGRGTPDVQLLVVGAGGGLAGIGELGELAFRSPHLARGYIGDPELTAARFVPNPFGHGFAWDRLYRTGDLGRYAPSGEVVFAGRTDDQVKIRGFRIELGDVNAAIAAVRGVAHSAVVFRPDPNGEKRLVAYVVAQAEGLELSFLEETLTRTLPAYMVPSAFVQLDAMPLTPNGKIDRKALPSPHLAMSAAEYVAPRTPTEKIIAEIWIEILPVARVGVTDDFFALGGHSLLAARVAARLRALRGVDVSVRTLLDVPTLAALAEHVDAVIPHAVGRDTGEI